MILLVKLLGIYIKDLFICIDEFILQVPDNLKVLGRFYNMCYGVSKPTW